MRLEILRIPLLLHRSVAPCPGIIKYHRLLEQLKALHFLDRALGGLGVIKDHKSLAFRFKVALGYEVDNGAVLGKDFCQGFFHLVDLNAFLEVLDL